MRKFKTKIRKNRLEVKYKLDRGEELNVRELEILANNNIRGIMQLRAVSPRKIEFMSPEAVPLRTYLGCGLTREDFALVIAQIVRIAQKISEYTLQLANLELSTDAVYIVKSTRELMFIYCPVISPGAVCDIKGFLNAVIRCTSFSAQQDTKYVEELEAVLKRIEKFPSELMSDYVKHLDSQIFDMVLSESGKRSPKARADDLTDLLRSDDDATGILDDDATGILDDDATGILDDDATGILDGDDNEKHSDDIILPNALRESETKGYSLLFGNNDGGDLYGLYGRTFGDSMQQGGEDDFSTGLLDDEDNLPTGLLDDEDDCPSEAKKAALSDVAENGTTLHIERKALPWLERCSNGECRRIEKPLFRIGKDKYHVDYFVDGNPAVSRNHAYILSKYGRYFIVDNNSLNHSFVDGMIVPVQKEYEIFDGSAICLANEDFVFHAK